MKSTPAIDRMRALAARGRRATIPVPGTHPPDDDEPTAPSSFVGAVVSGLNKVARSEDEE